MSFSKTSAGGGTGMAPAHLLSVLATWDAIVQGDVEALEMSRCLAFANGCGSPETLTRFLQKTTDLVHILLYGLSTPNLAPEVCGVNLLALQEDLNGSVRPLACGEVFRRLASKRCLKDSRDEIIKYFCPSAG